MYNLEFPDDFEWDMKILKIGTLVALALCLSGCDSISFLEGAAIGGLAVYVCQEKDKC